MKKLFHIPADNLSTESKLILALRVGEKHCCFAITGISGKKVYQLAYYSSNEIDERSLATLIVDNPALNNAFHKVVVCSDLPQSILVPINYFKSEEAEKILKNIYPLNDQFFTIAQTLPEHNFYNIYSIPKGVNDWLNRKFPNAEYFHDHSVSIRDITRKDDLRIDFRTDEFTMVAAAENKIVLAQTFPYSNPADVIYYLLKTVQQFSFSQQEVNLVISGLIEKESALFKELHQYFLHIEFKDPEWDTQYDYPGHFFTSLNDLIRCAS